MINQTLTQRLFLRIAPTILVTIAAIGIFAFYSASEEVNIVHDAQLINNANVLWGLVRDEFSETGTAMPNPLTELGISGPSSNNEAVDEYANSRMFRIWRNGRRVMYSATAPATSVKKLKSGFSNIFVRNEEWRVYSLPIEASGVSVEVGEKTDLRNSLVGNILLDLVFPLLILIPIVGLLIWVGIYSGLDKIRALVQQIRNRSPEDLSPLAASKLPRDLLPLQKSINDLFHKLDLSLTAERRFADHAAHQLRTPLASIKLLLQLLKKADNEQERTLIENNLTLSNERATKLVEQLLRAARISHQAVHLQPTLVFPMVEMVIADAGHLIADKHIDISLSGDHAARLMADDVLFRLFVSNLIDNAIKYTPQNGTVSIDVSTQGENCKLSIYDSGPGIPPEFRNRVFERFYRSDETGIEGAGLGLAIVASIVERFSGEIVLKDNPLGQGLLVEAIFAKV